MHKCKCAVCGQDFDRDKIQAVKYGARRYAHYTCAPDKELVPLPPPKEKTEDQLILEYCSNLFGSSMNAAMIKRQIKIFVKDYGYTKSGILKTLQYWYDIKHNDISKSNGAIGIVPYVFNDAKQYYFQLFVAQESNKNIISYKPKIEDVTIPSPRMFVRPPRLFNMEDDD